MLSRLVVDPTVPGNGASFLLAGSIRLLDRDRWPILLTYADTALGHTGAIYRATNWRYLGCQVAGRAWVNDRGHRIGIRNGDRNLTADELRARGYQPTAATRKHKFVQVDRRYRGPGRAIVDRLADTLP